MNKDILDKVKGRIDKAGKLIEEIDLLASLKIDRESVQRLPYATWQKMITIGRQALMEQLTDELEETGTPKPQEACASGGISP